MKDAFEGMISAHMILQSPEEELQTQIQNIAVKCSRTLGKRINYGPEIGSSLYVRYGMKLRALANDCNSCLWKQKLGGFKLWSPGTKFSFSYFFSHSLFAPSLVRWENCIIALLCWNKCVCSVLTACRNCICLCDMHSYWILVDSKVAGRVYWFLRNFLPLRGGFIFQQHISLW